MNQFKSFVAAQLDGLYSDECKLTPEQFAQAFKLFTAERRSTGELAHVDPLDFYDDEMNPAFAATADVYAARVAGDAAAEAEAAKRLADICLATILPLAQDAVDDVVGPIRTRKYQREWTGR